MGGAWLVPLMSTEQLCSLCTTLREVCPMVSTAGPGGGGLLADGRAD